MPNNRLDRAFAGTKPLTSVFFTAGYPFLDSTLPVLELLQKEKIDFVEIGFPFSDPVADGNVIQHSNEISLRNGMSLEVLFSQLKSIRKKVDLPILLMGYLNPIEQFGYERFIEACKEVEIDGLILPDLPLDLYKSKYKKLFNDNNIHGILLVTPTSYWRRCSYGSGSIKLLPTAG
jgi:tryptophan synthase alpha chain